MRWPWQKKKRGRGWAARREHEIARIEHLTDQLLIALNVDPGEWRRMVTERDELREKLKDAIANQRTLADEVHALRYSACSHCGEMWFAFAPHEQSKSDPDFDAAMASARREDEERKK
jgi:asparagine synthetase B (glutamine-hydrolysing)